MAQDKHLTYAEHFNELKWLFIRSGSIFFISFILYIVYYKEVSLFIKSDLSGIQLIYLSPGEFMAAILSLAIILALITIIPYLLIEIYVFVKPALNSRENIAAILLMPIILIILLGIIYLIYIYMPQLLRYILASQSQYARPILSFNAVVDFIWLSGLILFLNSIVPVIIIALTRILDIPKQQWLSARPFVVAGSFILGGLITTDDNLLIQAAFALWVVILYNIGIIFAKNTLKNEQSA